MVLIGLTSPRPEGVKEYAVILGEGRSFLLSYSVLDNSAKKIVGLRKVKDGGKIKWVSSGLNGRING